MLIPLVLINIITNKSLFYMYELLYNFKLQLVNADSIMKYLFSYSIPFINSLLFEVTFAKQIYVHMIKKIVRYQTC